MKQEERPLEWIGSSYKDLMQLPADVRKSVGFALHFAQHGEQHPASKVLKGFGGAGVLEVVENDGLFGISCGFLHRTCYPDFGLTCGYED